MMSAQITFADKIVEVYICSVRKHISPLCNRNPVITHVSAEKLFEGSIYVLQQLSCPSVDILML